MQHIDERTRGGKVIDSFRDKGSRQSPAVGFGSSRAALVSVRDELFDADDFKNGYQLLLLVGKRSQDLLQVGKERSLNATPHWG
jgi:hypothetical protein